MKASQSDSFDESLILVVDVVRQLHCSPRSRFYVLSYMEVETSDSTSGLKRLCSRSAHTALIKRYLERFKDHSQINPQLEVVSE